MPKRNYDDMQLDEESAEMGRVAGLIKRQSPDLWEAIRNQAKAKGMKVSDYLRTLIEHGMIYENYKDIDGATIMKVMDILDRMYRYMNGWLEQVGLEQQLRSVEAIIQLSETFAPMLGYRKEEDVKKEEIKEAMKQAVEEPQKRKTILDKIIEKIVERTAEKLVERISETETFEKIIDAMAQTGKQAVAQGLIETMHDASEEVAK